MPYNYNEITTSFKRIELCDLLIACQIASESSDSKRWSVLHDKIATIIDTYDLNCGSRKE